MRVVHPRALEDVGTVPASVDVRGESVPVDEDGTFSVPDDATGWLQTFADRYDVAVADLEQGDTCDVVMSNGEVCGRERPCPYHDESDE